MGKESKAQTNLLLKTTRSDADLAQMVAYVAQAVRADAVIFVIESSSFVQHLMQLSSPARLIAATANQETYDDLIKAGMETLRLPLHAADKYSQFRYVLSVAYRAARVAVGDLVVVAIACHVYPEEGDLIVITDVETGMDRLVITDLLKLTNGIRPNVLQSALTIACKIGRVVRRGGERIGAIFILGDSVRVMEGSRQLIPNPFHGHEDELRRLTNPDIQDTLVELSKLDGAFVIRGDGFIQSAAVFLATTGIEMELPSGLGTRHIAAAAVTARTAATAIVVSATDGNVRAYAKGQLVLQIDPEAPYGPISFDG